MECHSHKKTPLPKEMHKIALIGNPNVGKSVIFGILTGKYVAVSNYPGTTVEVAYGNLNLNNGRFLIIDTPGTNTLIPMSEDEKVTRDILLNEKIASTVQVADSKNLRRALLITLQLIEMGLPYLLVLNMDDEARSRGIIIDNKKLSEILSVPIIPTVATQRQGIPLLLQHIAAPACSKFSFKYDEQLEDAIKEITQLLPDSNIAKRSLAVMLLSGDESLKEWLHSKISDSVIKTIDSIYQRTQTKYHGQLGYLINQRRLRAADEILQSVFTPALEKARGIKESFGKWSMHPVWGILIMASVLIPCL